MVKTGICCTLQRRGDVWPNDEPKKEKGARARHWLRGSSQRTILQFEAVRGTNGRLASACFPWTDKQGAYLHLDITLNV